MNKVLKFSLFLFVVVYMFSCQENDKIIEDPQILLEITTPSDYILFPQESWVILSDSNGDIILTEMLVNDDSITLIAPPGFIQEKFNVSIIKALDFNGSSYYEINTYLNVTFDKWKLNGFGSDSKSIVGTIDFSITGITGFHSATVSTIDRFSGLSGIGVTTADLSVDVYRNPSDVIASVVFRDKEPVYAKMQNAKVDSSCILDINHDFNNYDQSVEFSIPSNDAIYLSVAGLNTEEELKDYGFYLYRLWDNSGLTDFRGYYVNGYKYYRTGFSYKTGNYNYLYYKLGQPITQYESPNLQFEVINDDISNFEYSLTGNFDYRKSSWEYWEVAEDHSFTKQYNWNVFGAANTEIPQIIHEIPTQILEKYPFINKDKLVYKETEFTNYEEGNSMDDYLEKQFKTDKHFWEIIQEYHRVIITSESANGRFSTDHNNLKNIKEWWELFKQ